MKNKLSITALTALIAFISNISFGGLSFAATTTTTPILSKLEIQKISKLLPTKEDKEDCENSEGCKLRYDAIKEAPIQVKALEMLNVYQVIQTHPEAFPEEIADGVNTFLSVANKIRNDLRPSEGTVDAASILPSQGAQNNLLGSRKFQPDTTASVNFGPIAPFASKNTIQVTDNGPVYSGAPGLSSRQAQDMLSFAKILQGDVAQEGSQMTLEQIRTLGGYRNPFISSDTTSDAVTIGIVAAVTVGVAVFLISAGTVGVAIAAAGLYGAGAGLGAGVVWGGAVAVAENLGNKPTSPAPEAPKNDTPTTPNTPKKPDDDEGVASKEGLPRLGRDEDPNKEPIRDPDPELVAAVQRFIGNPRSGLEVLPNFKIYGGNVTDGNRDPIFRNSISATETPDQYYSRQNRRPLTKAELKIRGTWLGKTYVHYSDARGGGGGYNPDSGSGLGGNVPHIGSDTPVVTCVSDVAGPRGVGCR